MPAGAQGRAAHGDTATVVAVIVTYNRRDLLIESLDAVYGQTRAPDLVIVVDNASTDQTAAAVRSRFPSAQLASMPCNTGGAGGFAYGIALALAGGADAVWLMDDDTVPAPAALEALLEARSGAADLAGGQPPALVASRVTWTDGRAHPMNTPRPKPFASRPERADASAAGCVPIRSASFVSVLVDADVCRSRGLPRADYFLWNDDFEYTTRLLRGRRGLLCPKSVAVHKTAAPYSSDADPGPRFYYEVRNKIWTLRGGTSLALPERVLYGGATLRRWARTFATSSDRRVLRRSFLRGLAAGLRSRPRPTDEVLAAAGVTVPAVGPALPVGRGRGDG